LAEMTEVEVDSLPEMIAAERQASHDEAVYLSAASAWHEALRKVGKLDEPDPAVQKAADDAQAAYVAARDRLEATRAERDETRLRLYQERLHELKTEAMVEALARQDEMRRHDRNGDGRGLLSRLFGRR
jgi:hypothetical protein